MSINTARSRHGAYVPEATRVPDATRGIVGPQSGADPEARLRRLLMMGVKERARAMQKSAPTGARTNCSLLASDPGVKAT